MNKKNRAILCLIILVLTTLSCGIFGSETNSSNQNDWEKYTSSNGQYSVLFPASPTEDSSTMNSSYGQVVVYKAKVEINGIFYGVGFNELPSSYIQENSTNSLLDNSRNQMIDSVNGQLITEEIISLQGYSGREIKLEAESNGQSLILIARTYLVENRLYTLTVVTTPENDLDSSIQKFLNSFTLN